MMTSMTKKLQDVLKRTEAWPEEVQAELADAALKIAAGLEGDYHATGDELAGIDRGLADAERGRLAVDKEAKAALGRFRRA